MQLKSFFLMLVLAFPVYTVLRSFAVDEGDLVDHACTGLVSAALAVLWAKIMSQD